MDSGSYEIIECRNTFAHEKSDAAAEFQRIYDLGCFDIYHYAHANHFRQAKSFTNELLVGILSDEIMASYKRESIFKYDERIRMVSSTRWVDAVVKNVSLSVTNNFLDAINCEVSVHGEDIALNEKGKDLFEEQKNCGRYKSTKRTPGISATELTSRMKNAIIGQPAKYEWYEPKNSPENLGCSANLISQFSSGQVPKPSDKVVYIAGGFDLFNPGHVDFLEQARKLGDYLIVGVHDDHVVAQNKPAGFPIMTMPERAMAVLSCRYVSDVLLGAPFTVTKEFIDALNIDMVCHGSRTLNKLYKPKMDPYTAPKQVGKFTLIDSGNDMTESTVLERVKKVYSLPEQQSQDCKIL